MEQDNHEHDVQSENSGEKTPFATGTMGLVSNAVSSVMLQISEAEPARINELKDHDQDRSGSQVFLLGAQEVDSSVQSEAIASTPQENGENMAAKESRTLAHEQLLKDEESVHQQTHAQLTRTEACCRSLQDENDTLQTQLDHALRGKTTTQRHLNDAEDGNLGLQTALCDAKGRIRALKLSIKKSLRTIQALQNHAVGLKADVSRYTQLGTDFYIRLQISLIYDVCCDKIRVINIRLAAGQTSLLSQP